LLGPRQLLVGDVIATDNSTGTDERGDWLARNIALKPDLAEAGSAVAVGRDQDF
jgi:hypothetical protein